MIAPSPSMKGFTALAISALVLDQISKFWILAHFDFMERVNIIPQCFDLTLVYNPGAAFSFLAGAGGWQKYLFFILAIVVSFFLIRTAQKGKFSPWGFWGAAMVVGGAIGNAVDRVIHGQVVDFILVYWQNYYYPAFNIADSFICVGVACLLIDSFKHSS